MRPFTLALFGAVVLLAAVSAFFFTHLHGEHLHHVGSHVQLISKQDHDRFLREGIHCDETYTTQGYEGPESILRMFGMTQQHFQELNPGVPLGENPRGTVVCVKGVLGPSQEAFHWFWPITGAVLALLGVAFSWLIRRQLVAPRALPSATKPAAADAGGAAPAAAAAGEQA